MCQLTYIHTKNKELTKNLLYWLMLKNSDTANKDGYGIFSIDTRYYCKDLLSPAADIKNFYESISKEKIGTQTVFAHVRAASLVGGKRIIDITKNHPFIRKGFVFFHNGTMTIKSNVKELKIPDGMIDSEFFANQVEKRVWDGDSVYNAVKTEYETNWNGKFAFMVYDLKNKIPIIFRGSSATLFKAKIMKEDEEIGVIVNTEKDSIEQAFLFFKWARVCIGDSLYSIKEVEPLKPDSSYIAEGLEIKELETGIKETYEYSKPTVWQSGRAYDYDDENYYSFRKEGKLLPGGDTTRQNFFRETSEKISHIQKFMENQNIGIRGLDIFCRAIVEVPLMEVSEKDLDILILAISLFEKELKSRSKKHQELFANIVKDSRHYFGTHEDFCDYFNLEFPIHSNDYNKVKKAHTTLIKDMVVQ